jgi:hypothetical protein
LYLCVGARECLFAVACARMARVTEEKQNMRVRACANKYLFAREIQSLATIVGMRAPSPYFHL